MQRAPNSWGPTPNVKDRQPPEQAASRWEVGSEFGLESLPDGPFEPWPTDHRLFSLATHAVIAAWRSLPDVAARALLVPDYFCPDVVNAWRHAGITIREYRDDPRWREPDWTTLRPGVDDCVLAVDFFGVRGGSAWNRVRKAHPRALFIEDHSHDPRSTWAIRSTADFAFASLRKTMPVSDGAILWSPRGRALPASPDGAVAVGSVMKYAAMEMKAAFLSGAAVDRSTFRDLQLRGEADLLAGPACRIGTWNVPMIRQGIPRLWRQRRESNVRAFSGLVDAMRGVRSLFNDWPSGHCPFNAVLLFGSQRDRDACQALLIAHAVFAPVHWAQPITANDRVRDLGRRILTIPVDHRYDLADVRRVAEVLLTFEPSDPALLDE